MMLFLSPVDRKSFISKNTKLYKIKEISDVLATQKIFGRLHEFFLLCFAKLIWQMITRLHRKNMLFSFEEVRLVQLESRPLCIRLAVVQCEQGRS